MADEEQVRILRVGVDEWNDFVWERRKEDLSWRANLFGADLTGAELVHASLTRADLTYAELSDANLLGADLLGANLTDADLQGANLTQANLFYANLLRANLMGANLTGATCGETTFATIRIAGGSGLASASHQTGSSIDTRTLARSKGKIPDAFLKGCGLADWEILNAKLYDPNLQPGEVVDILYEVERLRNTGPIQINPVFLSYSRHDSGFVDELQKALDKKGVRTWRDTKDAEAGPLDRVLGRAIEVNRIVLIVLSEASCYSGWVQWEIDKAVELERELGKPVLCPVAIDGAWLKMLPPPQLSHVKRYNVIDLSKKGSINKEMPRILKGLQIHYRDEKKNADSC